MWYRAERVAGKRKDKGARMEEVPGWKESFGMVASDWLLSILI